MTRTFQVLLTKRRPRFKNPPRVTLILKEDQLALRTPWGDLRNGATREIASVAAPKMLRCRE